MAPKIFRINSTPNTLGEYFLEAVYAGIFGGSAVAICFLFIDILNGQPLFTPSLLGSVLFLGFDATEVASVRLDAVFYFSLVHVAGFTALGALASFVVHEVELYSKHPAIVLLVFFGIIEAAFFVIAPLAFPGVVGVLGIARIAFANLFGAIALAVFFVVTHHAATRGKFKHNIGDFAFDSVYSGAIGGAVVALYFLAVDSIAGVPFATPALIGHVLFEGVATEAATNLAFAAVPPVILVHLGWSAVMGMVITFVVHEVELHARHPVEVLLVLFVLMEVTFMTVAPLVIPGVITELGIVHIGAANLLAAVGISLFFLWSHENVPGDQVPDAETTSSSSEG
jgi:hypothetical protein